MPASDDMPEAKRDEVPLPKAIAHLSIDPKPYPYLPRMLAHDNPVKGSKPVVLLDDVIAYGRQCVQAAVPVMPQEIREAINPFLAGRWPHGAAGRIGTLIDWLRSQNLIKDTP